MLHWYRGVQCLYTRFEQRMALLKCGWVVYAAFEKIICSANLRDKLCFAVLQIVRRSGFCIRTIVEYKSCKPVLKSMQEA